MNIFSALSQGKGRLNEENMSAMLAFLLSPTEAHGLGDAFLRQFLTAIAGQFDPSDYLTEHLLHGPSADVFLERNLGRGGVNRFVDIDLRVFIATPSGVATDQRQILIENKIRAGAANQTQLREQYQLACDSDEDLPITVVFLTPPGEAAALSAEYEGLSELRDGDDKVWLRWSGSESPTVVSMIRDVLSDEITSEIDPISDYVRHTLKAFVRHILSLEASPKGLRVPFTPGTCVRQAMVSLSGREYRLEQYDSGAIRVLSVEEDEYLSPVKPFLRQAIDDLSLPVDKVGNTRTLGATVLDNLPDS